MADWQTYQHTPLTSSRHIRLLKFQPSNDELPIRCSMFELSLDSTSRKRGTCYNALSYTWASSHSDTYIICDGRRLQITGNCELSLRRFLKRRGGDPPLLPLWIDAICIWQSNIEERNMQVSMMGEIYTRACHVLIWLGTGFRDSDFLFKWAKRTLISRWLRDLFKSGFSYDLARLRRIEATLELMKLPWFSRVWTIQEAVLAQDPVVFCGDATIRFDNLTKALYYDPGTFRSITKRISFLKHMRDLPKLNNENGLHEGPDLTWIMEGISDRGATEPKDKIFAIRDLLRDLGTDLGPPDYTLPLGIIYKEATKVILEQDLRILQLVYDSSSPDLGAPSWVPDFRDSELPKPFEGKLGEGLGSLFSKESSWLPAQKTHSLSEDGQSLKLNAIVLDTVRKRSALEIWHPGKGVRISHAIVNEIIISHALEVLHPLQEYALMARETATSNSGHLWQHSFLSAIAGGRVDPHDAKSWCETLLASRDAQHKSVNNYDIENIQLLSPRLDKYWSQTSWKILWRDVPDIKFNQAASASEALANGCSMQAVILFLLLEQAGSEFLTRVLDFMRRRAFFVTDKNFFGIGPTSAKPGDTVATVHDLDFPMIIRATDRPNEYRLVGQACVVDIPADIARWRNNEQVKISEDVVQKTIDIYLI